MATRLCRGCGCDFTLDEEHNEEACERIQKDFTALQLPKKLLQQFFPSIFVSAHAENLIADLEGAMQAHLTSDDARKSYTHLNQCRKVIYTYIETLEQQTNRKRTVRKRF